VTYTALLEYRINAALISATGLAVTRCLFRVLLSRERGRPEIPSMQGIDGP
jgi:hypothetical protein